MSPVGWRVPGVEGQPGRPTPNVRDSTNALAASPTYSWKQWFDDGYDNAVRKLMQAGTWLDTQPMVVELLGNQSYGVGTVYGAGESLVKSVAEMLDLMKVFILADLYEQEVKPTLWQEVADSLRWGPFASARMLVKGWMNDSYRQEIKEAYEQREALIEAFKQLFANPSAAFDAIAQEYKDKWALHERLRVQQSLSARFESGKIMGEILLEVLGLIAGGAGIARALVTKFPKLAKLAGKMEKVAKAAKDKLLRKKMKLPDPKAEGNPVETPSQAKGSGDARAGGKLAPGSPEHKAARWQRYQDRGGKWDYDRWSKQYDTNMQNYQHGLRREVEYRTAMGADDTTLKTPFTDRQIDIYKPAEDYLGQLKTGKVSLTKENIVAIEKDAWFVKDGYKVEHILEQGASKNYLDALDKAGITYKIGPQIP